MFRILTITAVGLALLGWAEPSHACSFADYGVPTGPLVEAMPDQMVPRNLAFLWRPDGESSEMAVALDSTGQPIVGQLIPGTTAAAGEFILRADPILPANTTISAFGGGELTTGDFVDEVAPEQPELAGGDIEFYESEQGCSKSSCEDHTKLKFSLSRLPADDLTASEDLVYAVYLGSTAESAASKDEPLFLVHRATEYYLVIEDSWVESDAFVAVSAYDAAGNQSPRSAPLRVNAELSGCALSASSPRRGFPLFTLGIAAMACAGRRFSKRRQRRSEGGSRTAT